MLDGARATGYQVLDESKERDRSANQTPKHRSEMWPGGSQDRHVEDLHDHN